MSAAAHAPGEHPDLPPPPEHAGLWAQVRRHLFSGPVDTALTVLAAVVVVAVVPPIFEWTVLNAKWTGSGPQDCPPASQGACWIIVGAWARGLAAGFYPQAELWRPALALLVVAAALVPLFVMRLPGRRVWLGLALAAPFLCFLLLRGGLGLEIVPTMDWGGFLLTLVVGLTGIAAALPIGIVLALGRRSSLPVVRILATIMIEVPRGVPLITLLFMASVMLPLFLPSGVELDKLLRALVVVSLFEGAYMAEVVRGGLQAIPKGQREAAEALGLGYWQTQLLIVLPQALRLVIPSIVNSYIGLFKDTTLVSIIGLFDLLGMADAALKDPSWLGRPGSFFLEVYAVVALVFFVCCFAMSRASLWLEHRLAHGADEVRS
jgi:general L-amino acid transport system permease protein